MPMFPSDAHLVPQKSIFEFTMKDIDGADISLKKYANKIIVLLNVASLCGLTHRNYTELQELYLKYKKDGLEVLAFPCNQFADMEPGTNAEIKAFVEDKYNGTFPLFAKIDVNGPNQHPLFKFLKATRGGIRGFYRDNIKWNFAKFVIGKDGVVIERFTPTTSPKMIEKFLRSLLFPPKDDGSGGNKEIRSCQCSRLVMDYADCTGTYWETAWGPKGGELFWGEERPVERRVSIKSPDRRRSKPPPPKRW
ncbi:hypothetical protein M758_2G107100 [Ceratodon purpureus]|nr:hypothetical protein M758_2G107100 [Ceratodon purpureus]